MKTLYGLLTFIALSAPIYSQACFAPRPEQVAPVEALVSRVSNIYLALAEAKSSDGFVEFKVIESLKGKKSNFKVAGRFLESEVQTDFEKHGAKDFWEPSGGRMQIQPNCQITPSFARGKRYLIFLDKPYHLKSFELIQEDDDAWLTRVKKELKLK